MVANWSMLSCSPFTWHCLVASVGFKCTKALAIWVNEGTSYLVTQRWLYLVVYRMLAPPVSLSLKCSPSWWFLACNGGVAEIVNATVSSHELYHPIIWLWSRKGETVWLSIPAGSVCPYRAILHYCWTGSPNCTIYSHIMARRLGRDAYCQGIAFKSLYMHWQL